jgi:hypothetical protein
MFTVAALIAIINSSGISQSDESGNVKFNFAFGALTGHMKNREFVSIRKDTVLRSYDSLKLMVELKTKCYVYIVYNGSDGNVQLLFPYSLKQFTADYSIDKNYYIPEGKDWYSLDDKTGAEKFYIIASAQRLTELETVLEKHLAAKAGEKNETGKMVVEKVREAKKKYKTYTTLAERPISIGGNIRALDTGNKSPSRDVAEIATMISANNFFSKTITIDHQP